MRRRLPWALLGLTLLLLSVANLWAVLGRSTDEIVSAAPLLVLAGVVVPGTGAFIARRRPDHPVGWLYLCAGCLITLAFASIAYAEYGLLGRPRPLPGAELAAWLGSWVWSPATILLATFPFLVFPDGRLPSRRWRPVAWACAAAVALTAAYGALTLGGDPVDMLTGDGPGGPQAAALAAALGLGALGMLASVVALFVRLRRATGDERQQLKWFLAAGTVFALGLPFAFEPLLAVPGAKLASHVALYAIPLATGVAITKYRLYDIDRLISRALAYVTLSGLLAGTYLLGVVVLQQVLAPVAGGSQAAVAGSTLAVAALFRPLRTRVQAVIDRRFDRARYDAELTVARFAARLRDQVDLDEVRQELLTVVRQTSRPARISLWLRDVACL